MKTNFDLKEQFKKFCILCIPLFVLIFLTNLKGVVAFPMDNYQSGVVIEELRLEVPYSFKKVWLEAEKNIWDPWLSSREGFLGEIFLEWKMKGLNFSEMGK